MFIKAIDDYVTFAVNTHDPTSGAEIDADAVPSYRIYEDETGTPILTGNMAKLDDANTLGFYSERIQLTAANGFENDKCYTIRVRAVVGGTAGSATIGIEVIDMPSVQDVVDGILDELLSAHIIPGSVAAGITGASSAGDPWTTTLPGSYTTGQAGKIIGDRIDALISSRLAPTIVGRTLDVTLTGEAGVDLANVGSPTTTLNLSGTTIGSLSSTERLAIADALLTRTLGTETYAADGAVPTLNQCMFMLLSKHFEMAIVGTTMTCKKLDGTTTSMTFTLDDATTPTAITRAT